MVIEGFGVLLLLAFISLQTDAARILAVFPTPSISHQVVFRPLTHELAKRGHEVIVVTPDPVFPKGKSPTNLTEVDVHDLSYKHWQDLLMNDRVKKGNLLQQIKTIIEKFGSTLDLQLQSPDVKEIMKKDKNYFDLLLLEACVRPALGFRHLFNASVILISSFGTVPSYYSLFGAPMHVLLYPTPERHRLYNLSLWEKGVELFKYLMMQSILFDIRKKDYEVMSRHFGPDVPTVEELRNDSQLLFINEHPIWADNRPVPPNVVYIGGIHEKIDKELPQNLKSYLDSSKNGVIYVSFGTNVIPSLISPEKVQVMLKVFSELPYDVLMKWDKEKLTGQPKNVKIYDWFPQADLLKHPNIKLFVTQGGLQSTDEAISAAVPVIGIPMLGDQWYNTEKYVRHKIGLQLDIQRLNVRIFKNAIETIINEESYKNNILRLRTLMREYPIKPLDHAVWWTEHVIKYGGQHLRSPAANMDWTEYYELKLVSIVLCIFLVTLSLIAYIVRKTFKFVCQILSTIMKNKLKQS